MKKYILKGFTQEAEGLSSNVFKSLERRIGSVLTLSDEPSPVDGAPVFSIESEVENIHSMFLIVEEVIEEMRIEDEEWEIGWAKECVITSRPSNKSEEDKDLDNRYFGGNPVCQVVAHKDHMNAIAAVPEMIRVLKQIRDSKAHLPYDIWNKLNNALCSAGVNDDKK